MQGSNAWRVKGEQTPPPSLILLQQLWNRQCWGQRVAGILHPDCQLPSNPTAPATPASQPGPQGAIHHVALLTGPMLPPPHLLDSHLDLPSWLATSPAFRPPQPHSSKTTSLPIHGTTEVLSGTSCLESCVRSNFYKFCFHVPLKLRRNNI